jgi:5'-3' exoribonuclease 1
MTSETSEIVDFYPRSFTIDMNGKRWPWEAVVLLPFIDSKRLLAASASVDDSLLTESEKDRNKFGTAVVFEYDEDTSFDLEEAGDTALFRLLPGCKTKATNFDDTLLAYKEPTKPTMTPKLSDGVKYPLPAFPTLRDGSVVSIWRKLLRINVHGSKSRYKTACLEIQNPVPENIALEDVAKNLIGTIVYIQYPHHVPSFVTAVSNSQGYFRGKDSEMQQWTEEELTGRTRRLSRVVNNYVFGEKLVGTGGITLVDGEEVMVCDIGYLPLFF